MKPIGTKVELKGEGPFPGRRGEIVGFGFVHSQEVYLVSLYEAGYLASGDFDVKGEPTYKPHANRPRCFITTIVADPSSILLAD